jgi:hypothetical protein
MWFCHSSALVGRGGADMGELSGPPRGRLSAAVREPVQSGRPADETLLDEFDVNREDVAFDDDRRSRVCRVIRVADPEGRAHALIAKVLPVRPENAALRGFAEGTGPVPPTAGWEGVVTADGSPCLDAALGPAGLRVHGAEAGEPGGGHRCDRAVAAGATRGDRVRGDASAPAGEV